MVDVDDKDIVKCSKIHNVSDLADAEKFLYTDLDKLILQVIIPSVSVMGVVGNCAFLFMIMRLPKMRTSLSAYLACLAVSDVMFLVWSNIWYAITQSRTDVGLAWPASSILDCVWLIVSTHIWYFASVGFTTLISVERYLAVCHPLKHIRIQGKNRNIKILMATWLLALILTSSYIPRYTWFKFVCFIWPQTKDFVSYPYALGICGSMHDVFNTYEGALMIAVFIISGVGNGVLYFKIIVALGGRPESFQSKIATIRNQVAQTLVINGIVFFICQIPSRIDNLDDVFDYLQVNFDVLDVKQEASVTTVGHAFLFLNSIINPYIYVFSCQHYRQGMLEVFLGKKNNSEQGNIGNRMCNVKITA